MADMQSPVFEVTIEVPRWGFVKKGSTETIDFVSPLPCPYNYGAIDAYVGLDGDLLDAVVLGPRMRRGTIVNMNAYGVIGLTDRGMYDDKLICSTKPLSAFERFKVLNFFRLYAVFKRALNFLRRRSGPTMCEGWRDLEGALQRATPRDDAWGGPRVEF